MEKYSHKMASPPTIYENIIDRSQDVEELKKLLETPSVLDFRTEDGATLLHAAAARGDVNFYIYLDDSGLEPLAVTNTGQTVLHMACGSGRFDMVKHITAVYPEVVHKVDSQNKTALYYLAYQDNTDILEYLIEKGADPSAESLSGSNIFLKACWTGQMKLVDYLLGRCPELKSTTDNMGQSALHLAAKTGNTSLFKLLIKNEVKPMVTSKKGETVLHYACWSKNLELVKYITQNYPELITISDYEGHTPLHATAKSGSIEIFIHLCDQKSTLDPLAVTTSGRTILHLACLKKRLSMVQFLVKNYPDLQERTDNEKFTAFHLAVQEGNEETLKFLIEQGFDPYNVTKRGQTVLHLACEKGMKEIEDILLTWYRGLRTQKEPDQQRIKQGKSISLSRIYYAVLDEKFDTEKLTELSEEYPEDIWYKSEDGVTVLHRCAESGHVDFFKLLVQKGLKPSLTNMGQNILHRACCGGYYNMVKYISSKYPEMVKEIDAAQTSALYFLAEANSAESTEIFKYLTKKGLSPYYSSLSGLTVLLKACYNGKFDLVKFLVENYSDLKTIQDTINQSALHWTAQGGDVEIFKYLVQQGLDPKQTTKTGQTVLVQACWSKRYEMVEFLVREYPELKTVTDNIKHTPLHWAAKVGAEKIFKLLVKEGLDPYCKDETGRTVLHLAYERGKQKMITAILMQYPELKTDIDSDQKFEKRIAMQAAEERERSSGIGSIHTSSLASLSPTASVGSDTPDTDEFDELDYEDKVQTWDTAIEKHDLQLNVQTYIKQADISLQEKRTLLQWFCGQVEEAYSEQKVVEIWPGTTDTQDLALVAMVENEVKHLSDTLATMKLILRKKDQVSSEAEHVHRMELDSDSHFDKDEDRRLQECLVKNSNRMMKEHRNLQIMSASKLKSVGYGTGEHKTEKKTCIVFYVPVKGVIPLGEEPFPKELDGFPTDVREGYFWQKSNPEKEVYYQKLVMGCTIGTGYDTGGALGGFVVLDNGNIGCLTCWHVFVSPESKEDLAKDPVSHRHLKPEVYQPNRKKAMQEFGILIRREYYHGREDDSSGEGIEAIDSIGVDAALIEIVDTTRQPQNGNFPETLLNKFVEYPQQRPPTYTSGKVVKSFSEVPLPCQVFKNGPTSELTHGALKLKGTAIRKGHFTYSISEEIPDEYQLYNQLEVDSGNKRFSDRGDSGSLVFMLTPTEDGGKEIHALGLVVGGTSYRTTIVTPIWAVLKSLNLPLQLLVTQPGVSNLNTRKVNSEDASRLEQLESEVSKIKESVTTCNEGLSQIKETLDTNSQEVSEIKENTRDLSEMRSKLNEVGNTIKHVAKILEAMRPHTQESAT